MYNYLFNMYNATRQLKFENTEFQVKYIKKNVGHKIKRKEI